MGDTKIEWSDKVWNPVTGCTKVSPGCSRCYAETVDHRFDHDKVGKLPWAFPASTGGRGVTLHPERLLDPLRWRKPKRIFVNSMSDLFHEDIPDDFIMDVLAVIERADWHVFQVLTKRPKRMLELFTRYQKSNLLRVGGGYYTLPNLWLGVSVENQTWADRRIPLLLQTPAVIHFVSCEPLLGPVDLSKWLDYKDCTCDDAGGHEWWCGKPPIDWIIAGGESGPKARPMHPDWARSLRDQCEASGVPFFFKQWGEWLPLMDADNRGLKYSESADFVMMDRRGKQWRNDWLPQGGRITGVAYGMKRVGKKAAGAVLDGQEYRQFPGVSHA